MERKWFNEKSFWPAFEKDLESAQSQVLIQSPFVSERRIKSLSDTLKKLADRKIRVCVFIQPARRKEDGVDDLEYQKYNRTLAQLKDLDVHVNLRSRIHSKLAVIDQSVLWEGSLNILSHFDAIERMRRFTDTNDIDGTVSEAKLDECDSCQIRKAG